MKLAATGRCAINSSSLELSDSESDPPVAKNLDILESYCKDKQTIDYNWARHVKTLCWHKLIGIGEKRTTSTNWDLLKLVICQKISPKSVEVMVVASRTPS